MKTPHVDSIGITQFPGDFSSVPRRLTLRRRVLALVMLVLFTGTVVATSIVSLGGYCLTSHGGDTRHLPARAPAATSVDSPR